MIVRYAYKDRNGHKVPHACVVFIDEDNFGVSVCASGDTFNKKRGRQIAAARAYNSIEGTRRVLDNMKGNVVVDGEAISRQASVAEACTKAKLAAANYFKAQPVGG